MCCHRGQSRRVIPNLKIVYLFSEHLLHELEIHAPRQQNCGCYMKSSSSSSTSFFFFALLSSTTFIFPLASSPVFCMLIVHLPSKLQCCCQCDHHPSVSFMLFSAAAIIYFLDNTIQIFGLYIAEPSLSSFYCSCYLLYKSSDLASKINCAL